MKQIIQANHGKLKGKRGIYITLRDTVNNQAKALTVHGYNLEEAYNQVYFTFYKEVKEQEWGVKIGKKAIKRR